MKKLSILISLLILVFSLNFLGCNSKSPLLSSITDARVDVYSATSENLTLTCNYGYTVNKDKVNYLSFRLNADPLSEITYTVKITLDKYVHSSMEQKRLNMEKLQQSIINHSTSNL